MTTVTFTTAGSSTWLCPAGVTSVRAECWGGGGAGGANGGSGGGGGEYASEAVVAVTPGTSYPYTAGAPGAGGAGAGPAGADSSFAGDAFTVTGNGAAGGATFSAVTTPGGSGSSASVHFAGGTGGAGGTTHGSAGGGGGSAGTGSAGNAGQAATSSANGAGASAVTGGGPGGTGAGSGGTGSAPSSGPGGGGGGGDGGDNGGSGRAGQVRLTWTSELVIAGQPATVTVRALAGTITNTLQVTGPAAGVIVTALPGTVSGASVTVTGPVAGVTVTALPGIATGPPVTVSGPPAGVIVTALAGTAGAVAAPGTVSTRSERASLVIAGQIELLQGGVLSQIPACAGATFYLAPAYDLGTPQPVVDIVGELIVDGERPFGRRASNRTITLPIVISAPDIGTLTAARETLLQVIDPQQFTLTWCRDGGLPLVFDCFRNLPPVVTYSVSRDRQLFSQVQVTFQALPYGRSDIPQQLTFASPAAGSAAPPPPPVTLDDYESVSGAGWSASGQHITGTRSAHWTAPRDVSAGPSYTSTFAPATLSARTVLQHWAGFASPSWWYYWTYYGMTASFAYVLRDTSGRTLRFGRSLSATPSASAVPNWTLVSASIPQGAAFDYGHVVSCTITITNSGSQLSYTDAYLDDLTAQPVTTSGAVASVRGSLYTLHGIAGTSHAPLALQFQQPPSTTPTTVTLTGSGTWLCPAGVTTVSVRATGGGGAGAGLTAAGHGGGGGGGGYAADPALDVTPGLSYSYAAGAGGTQGATPADGGYSVITGDDATVRAGGGRSAAQDSSAGVSGGAAGPGTVTFAGGAGANGSATGGGGGAAASGSGPGPAATGTAGATGPSGDGGTGATGSAAGSDGTFPGGGGGGADSTSGARSGGSGAAGTITVTYYALPPFRTLIAHRPGPDSPANLTPFVSPDHVTDPPDGRQYPVVSQVAGVNARFGGTYSIVAVANSWNNPSAARTVTVTVWQTEYAGGPSSSVSVSRTFTPATDITNGIVTIGELTLPGKDIPVDNVAMFHTAGITDSNLSDQYLDILLLDTQGQTLIINETQAYSTYYLDEPASDRDIGRVLGSSLDRARAVSVLDNAFVSGGPLVVDPGDSQLFVYSAEGAPSLVATYSARWYLDRLS